MKLFSKKLWTVVSVILSTLLAIIISITGVAYERATVLNRTWNLKTFEQYNDGDGSGAIVKTTPLYKTAEENQDYFKDLSKRIEAEGLVLLKNDNDSLPLDASSGLKVSLFGTGAVAINASVQGMRGFTSEAGMATLADALASVNIEANPTLTQFYTSGAGSKYGGEKKLDDKTNIQTYYIKEVPWSEYTTVRSSFTEYGDAAIVVITRDSTEGSDVNVVGSDGTDGDYLSLSPEELGLLKNLTQLKFNGIFKTLIVLLNGSQPMEMDFLYNDEVEVDSCMWIGNIGTAGIYAVAEALVGRVVPSGRLTDTYVKDNLSSPAMASWALNDNKVFSNCWTGSGLNNTQSYYGVYVEGIYVGYRYYETRYADVVEGRRGVGAYDYEEVMAYPFGSGLSYTEFSYSDFTVAENADGKSYDVSVTVTNTGDTYTGKEAVHIYLQKPYTTYAQQHGMEVSAIEFAGFGKTNALAPGESETVTVNIEKTRFTSYDIYGAGTYILDGGDYYLTTGRDVHKALNNILAKKGFTTANGMTADGNAKLVWKTTFATDTTTYAVSDQTGYAIKNQLEDFDPNRYVGAGSNYVSYVSRSDWTGTWPTEKALLTLTDDMYQALQSDNPVESEGTMPEMGVANGFTLAMLYGKDYDDEDWDKLLDQLSFEDMNTLLTTAYCGTVLIETIIKPETKGMDGPTYTKDSPNNNNGNSCRLPCEGIWAATFNKDLIAEAGVALANDCLYAGFHEMWIPGINIHRTPYCGRYHEYFSEDPLLTGLAAQYEIEAIQKYGVIAMPKHYVFNDQEANRNGIGIWLNEQSAREIYLTPWKYACGTEKGNAHGVMSSFNRAGCGWTSASYALITEILRNEIGFDGYVLTDMADANGSEYMSCIDGIVAGTDTWFSSGNNHSFKEYRNNATVVNAMRDACHRTLYSVCNFSAAMNGYSNTTKVRKLYTWWEIAVISATTSVSVLTAAALVMLCLSVFKKRKED